MSALEKILEKLAFTTWDTIGKAYADRILYGEDAITSVNLLTLKNEPLRNFVLEDTRIAESCKGCDFEFWIGSNGKGWFRYAIQAKKIAVSNERYNSLAHKVRGIPQIDILETYANLNQAMPLYCFFNNSPHLTHYRSSCPKYTDIKELGCSITPLKTARTALHTRGARTFQWLHSRPETLPWSCLVRCPNISQHWPASQVGFDKSKMLHKELPNQLAMLLNHEGTGEQLLDSDVFSSETSYRPRWLGVFDTSQDNKND